MDIAAALGYFENNIDNIRKAIGELVDIESPSLDVAASREVADWVEAYLEPIRNHIKLERHEAENAGVHLLIRAFPARPRRTLLISHTDTVHPFGTNEKNPTRIDGDKFYGCGIFDTKANVVMSLDVLKYLIESGREPETGIDILLSCDEEVGSATGREFVEREARRAERCFVLEPSANGRVKTGRKGTGIFDVTATGLASHAGLEPEKGANAIAELARQIDKIQDIGKPELGTTVNVCTFGGGVATNVIPDTAVCSVDVRFTTIAEGERVERELNELKPGDERVELKVSGAINRPPLERTAAVVALYEKARSIGAEFNYDVGETQVGGASDGNFVAALGVPTLDGLGIAGDGAHTLHEHILISDIAKRAALLTGLLQSS